MYESENAGKSTDDFVMTFQTTTANETITIPTHPDETYNYEVDWEGNGIFEETLYTTTGTHTYSEPGDHTIRIRGTFPRIYFNDGPEKDKIQSIDQWGTNEWTSMENAFFGCSNLQITATDAPNLSNATDLSKMFSAASSMNAPLNNWDVSTIINMTGMFSGASAFNQPLNDWEVSEVTVMSGMFSGVTAFNQSLATWDISNVTAMEGMLDNTALTLDNYEVILETWSQLEGLQSGVILGAVGLRYSECVQPQKDILIAAPNNWTITDGGLVPGCHTDHFVTTWETITANETITIPTHPYETYNYEVDWEGLGVFENKIFDGNASHTYPEPGIHTVRIKGMFPRIYFHNDLEVLGQKDKILSVDQWGTNEWTSMNDAFWGCSKLEIVATDAPNLSSVTDLSGMFANAYKVNSPLSHWDVSTIENMRSMFYYALAFNQSLASWNVSNVDNMIAMLDSSNLSVENYSATLVAWSQLEGLQSLVKFSAGELRFSNCVQPERDILTVANGWTILDSGPSIICSESNFVMTWRTTTPNETITIPTHPDETYNYEVDWEGLGVFEEPTTTHTYSEPGDHTIRIRGTFPRIYFNDGPEKDKIQSIDQWGTNEWTSMENAFFGCSNLQITATDAPNLSNVTDLSEMFKGATSMNAASLKDWDVSNVTDMSGLFSGASAFNQPLNTWDVSNVTDMTGLFSDASAFNQSLASWDVSNVTVMDEMLDNTALSTEHYSAILEAWSQLEGLQPGVILGAVGLRYSECVQPQKDILIAAPNNWTITDGGLFAGCFPDHFVTTWETTTPNETITIPTHPDETYNYEVDWDGDGVFENKIFDGNAFHTYPEPGIHSVRIKGMFPRIYFHNDLEVLGQKDKILSVDQWGTNEWTSMNDAFWGCSNLEIVATDAPNLSSVTDLSGMFASAIKVNSPLSHWDVSTIENMKSMFYFAHAFNQSLASWNVSNVDNMIFMLEYSNLSVENYSATLVAWSQLEGLQPGVILGAYRLRYSNCVQPERDILTAAPNGWTISDSGPSIICSESNFVMTWRTTTPNETITIPTHPDETYNYEVDWEGLGVFEEPTTTHTYSEPGDHTIRIRGTFPRIYFNDGSEKDKIQSIDQWGTNEWTSMEKAFFGCSNLQITATDAPNLSNVTDLSEMFKGATSMNAASLKDWDVSNVTDMTGLFSGASAFNQSLASWDVSNVTDMTGLFSGASAFNQSLASWDVSNVTDMTGLFSGASAFNQSLASWDVSNVTDMTGLFSGASAFNQSLASWNVSNVTVMDEMLDITALSTGHYSAILKAWSQLEGLQPGVILGAVGLRYSECVQPQKDILTAAPNNWTITDGGLVAGCLTDHFVTTWETTTANETITIPTHPDETYNYEVDWDGDGVFENMIFDGNASHTYPEPGIHTVRIKGMFPRIYFNYDIEVPGQKDKILSVEQWGTNEWTSMNDAFFGCSNLEIVAADAPNLSSVTDLSGMFAYAYKVNSPLSHWDVSTIENMKSMFSYALAFNQSLASWNVSNVDNMRNMLEYSNLSVENYSATLVAWSQLEGLQSGVILDAYGLRYSNCVQPERDILTDALNRWVISDNGSRIICLESDFVMTWRTTTPNETITIPTHPDETYNYEVDWEGLGVFEEPTTTGTHTYSEPGDHTIRIRGTFPRIYFNDGSEKDKIQSIDQWGTNEWTSMENAFFGCSNLQITATDVPNLSNVTDLSEMFKGATSMNAASLKDWDVSNVTDMTGLFSGASAFNQSLASWDVSNVTDMTGLFSGASAFNQPLNTWDISNVTDMANMLDNSGLSTDRYSDTLEGWSQLESLNAEVSLGALGLTYFECIQPAVNILLNRPNLWTITDDGVVDRCVLPFITTWVTTTANETITIPTAPGETYNYDIDWNNDGVWDAIGATGNESHTYEEQGDHTIRIKGVFPRIYFHNDIEVPGQKDKIQSVDQWGDIQWNSMDSAFSGCSILRIYATDAPDLSNITSMLHMFSNTSSMNAASLNDWDVSNVTNMSYMFLNATAFNQPLSNWEVSEVTNMSYMFSEAETFNQSLASWDISNVTNMTNMLDNSGLSTDHYSAILEAWSQLEGLPSGVTLGAAGLMYSNCVQPQKDILTAAPNNWIITDAGFVDECSSTPTSYLQIGVNSRTISTILGIESTKHGVLLPRLTEVEMQAITTPAEGLMVYCLDCTTKGLYIYDGADFITLRTTGN